MRYGYASAPEPEDLQAQVEALEDAQIPDGRLYAELVNHGHAGRAKFEELFVLFRPGDEIVIRDLTALGTDLLDAYSRIQTIETMNITLCILELPAETSQIHFLKTLDYLGEIFTRRQTLEPSGGKPRKEYPAGWREAFRRYKSKEYSASETYTQLGIKEYEFFRMVHYYESAIKQRNSERKRGRQAEPD